MSFQAQSLWQKAGDSVDSSPKLLQTELEVGDHPGDDGLTTEGPG
jgi:hypothetical protein